MTSILRHMLARSPAYRDLPLVSCVAVRYCVVSPSPTLTSAFHNGEPGYSQPQIQEHSHIKMTCSRLTICPSPWYRKPGKDNRRKQCLSGKDFVVTLGCFRLNGDFCIEGSVYNFNSLHDFYVHHAINGLSTFCLILANPYQHNIQSCNES